MTIPRKGDEVKIAFDDHCEDHSKPYRFVVYGVVSKITDDAITVNSWAYESTPKRRDHNVKCFTICRGVITSIRVARWM